MASPGSGLTQLILHVNATTTLTLTIQTHAGDCTVINSGSAYAALDLGSGSKTTATSCATFNNGNTYTLTTSLDFNATCSGTCDRWKLVAQLESAPPTNVVWKAGGKTLSDTSAKQLGTNLTYGSVDNEAFVLSVKTNGATPAPTGQLTTTIDFTASDVTTTTATATARLNAEEINQPGISMYFSQDASGVAMTGGAFAANIDLGSVSAYGSLPSNVSRPSVTGTNYTVQTPFDIEIDIGGLASSNYTLQAALASAAGTGLTYKIDSTSLTTSNQTITSTGTYSTPVSHTLGIVILRVGGGSGPTINTPISQDINFTATAN